MRPALGADLWAIDLVIKGFVKIQITEKDFY